MIVKRNRRPKYTSTGRHSGYQIEIHHQGLGLSKSLSAVDDLALEAKIESQSAIWDRRWRQEQQKKSASENAEFALSTTSEYQKLLKKCEKILEHTLSIDDTVDWGTLKRRDLYLDTDTRLNEFKYRTDGYPIGIVNLPAPKLSPAPNLDDFAKEITLMDRLFGGTKKKATAQHLDYEAATKLHEEAIEAHAEALERQEKETHARKAQLQDLQSGWVQRKAIFDADVSQQHEEIERLKQRYIQSDTDAVIEYCEMVLSNSEYPFDFAREVSIFYEQDTKVLGLDYLLPAFETIPDKQSVKYVKTRDELEEKSLSDAAKNRLFESILYQVTIRTIHELFEADSADTLSLVSFNGWVDAVSAATGHSERKCILSVQAKKSDFEAINLKGICDQGTFKECFKSLKGVAAAKLTSLTPVRPIIEFNKTDKRFTDHYDVADGLDSSVNLASMDWEDFENLVREVFGKEFSANGGEVKVTQASRDGGVDAIAFDPDPIRGGKIVIQAKRYTNVVGVSAVRDLYGTVMNEGATKGILVTTSQYGPDAYSFAADKPLTLMNGSNLLHLLQKHGHHAKIDIAEAKRLISDSR